MTRLDHHLYERDTFTQDINYIIGSNIYEYDMKSAGLNLIKYYKLLPKEKIAELEDLSKYIRVIQVGLLMRDDKELSKSLSQAFVDMRKLFFEKNEIKASQVLSIKKDAIFLVNKRCDYTEFDNVTFAVKNKYSSFHKFDRYEFYYRNSGRVLDVKGIKDDKMKLHEGYMGKFLMDIFTLLENSSNDRVIAKIKRFVAEYKGMNLDDGYYRELTSESKFSLYLNGDIRKQFKSDDFVKGCDMVISYNYMNYILPLIQRFFHMSPNER